MVPFADAPAESICTVNSVVLTAVTTGKYLSFTKSAEDGCHIEQTTLGLEVNDFLNLIVDLPVFDVLQGTFFLPDSISVVLGLFASSPPPAGASLILLDKLLIILILDTMLDNNSEVIGSPGFTGIGCNCSAIFSSPLAPQHFVLAEAV